MNSPGNMHAEIVNEETRSKFAELSEWLSQAKEFKQDLIHDNVLQCVDEGQHTPVRACLEEPDFKKKVIYLDFKLRKIAKFGLGTYILNLESYGRD